MTSQLDTLTYNFASNLHSMSQTGWQWSADNGGSAQSNNSYASGTNPNYYRHLMQYWSGWMLPWVEADIPITASMAVGVCTGLQGFSSPGGYYGLYAGIFNGPAGSTHKVVRMWMEFNRVADVGGQFRVTQPSIGKVVEARMDKTSGTATLRLVVAANGVVSVIVDGVQLMFQDWAATWNAAPLTSWANTATTNSYAGVWATQANQYVSELRFKYPTVTTRGHPTAPVTKCATAFTGTDYTGWDPSSGNTVNVVAPLENSGVFQGGGIYQNRLSITSAWPGAAVPANDLDKLIPTYTGRSYEFMWRHWSGAYVFSLYYSSGLYLSRIRVSSNESGTYKQLQIGGSDLKGDSQVNTLWGGTYGEGSTLASGTWVRVLAYPQYSTGVGGSQPIASAMMFSVQTSTTSSTGPWTTRLSSTDAATGGGMYATNYPTSAKFGYATPSIAAYNDAQIDEYRVAWAPMTATDYGAQTGFQCYAFPYSAGSSTSHDLASPLTYPDIGYRGAMRQADKVTD